ncbi:MAG: permease-like cell division protein FtsX [Patescibacteria group bacterium]
MSFLISAPRILKFAWQNFWRNVWLSLITITILTLALLNVNALIVLNMIGDRAIIAIESKLDLSVSFLPETSEEIIAQARGYLDGLAQVRTITYYTPDEVLANFREENAGQPEVLASLDELDGNPLGAQLVITASNPDDFAFILEALQNPQYASSIEETDYNDYEQMIDKITATSRQIRNGGLVVGAIFVLIALMIVFNTIRVAIYTHREEIGIMRLVGASSLFVRAPFLLEAVTYALCAVFISMGVLYPVLIFIEAPLTNFLGVESYLVGGFGEQFWIIVWTEFIVFALLSMLATSLAMRKYLRL